VKVWVLRVQDGLVGREVERLDVGDPWRVERARDDGGDVELEAAVERLADHPAEGQVGEPRREVAVGRRLAAADVAVRACEPDLLDVRRLGQRSGSGTRRWRFLTDEIGRSCAGDAGRGRVRHPQLGFEARTVLVKGERLAEVGDRAASLQ
jgi:hypothetical protein